MKKFLKIFLWTIVSLVLILGLLITGFIYKVQNGFPVFYETEIPAIEFPTDKKAILLFSKSTGFRHGESIETGKKTFAELAEKNNWFLYSTEEGGVFNKEQLAKFDMVIFNNSTGRLLNKEQEKNLEEYVEGGGSLLGIHGAGDNSHHWDWYVKNLTGSDFSHHALTPKFEEAVITLHPEADSLIKTNLPAQWTHADEWYVFFENPRKHGFTLLYSIDGEKINANGNILWMKSKNFGMGKEHPVAWYKDVGEGHTYYTSLGHDATAWQQKPFVQMLENIVNQF
ncbi:MAG TPA: ThuA domain-containing protein [Cyclobacteriaceae bacterium]|nr:ThuA domain-containing protein [Cytophagales bacterium]HRF33403.1 ThuA domain-containing protein [Cyclobacteriaceae bacterium]